LLPGRTSESIALARQNAPIRANYEKAGYNSARNLLVEGKGFVYLSALSIRYFVAVTLQNAAN